MSISVQSDTNTSALKLIGKKLPRQLQALNDISKVITLINEALDNSIDRRSDIWLGYIVCDGSSFHLPDVVCGLLKRNDYVSCNKSCILFFVNCTAS